MRELEERYLKRLSELYPTIANGIYRDHQSAGDPESAKRNGTFPYRYPWRIPGLFSCSEKWVRFREAQDRRCFWKYCE